MNDDETLDPVDALLVQCLREPAEQRAAAVERLAGEHPRHAARLRRRYAFLCASGLIDAAAGAPPMPERIGGFRPIRRLGEGGMGVVYLAEQVALSRTVALKLIRPELLYSARGRERFRREALATSRLDHPGICAIHEVGEADGQPFLAMRYVPGRTLAAILDDLRRDQRRPDVAAMTARVAKVARALHAAHAAGLVHRDVKPANILVADDGEPVLLDFGLSLLRDGDLPQLTASGDVLGTPAYLAPEQIDHAAPARAAADIYALGVVLYEALTLSVPFAGTTRESLYRRILAGSPERARRRNPAIPADLQVVLEVAMDRDPDRRYATAAAFAADLDAVRAGRPIAARPSPAWVRALRWSQRNRLAAGALALLACGLAVVAALLLVVRRTADELAAQVEARRFWDLKDRDPAAAVAAALAAQASPSAVSGAALRAALTLAWPRTGFVPQDLLVLGCAVDPHAEVAAWVERSGHAVLWRLARGEAGVQRLPVQSTWAPQLAWSPDGERLAVAGNDGDDTDAAHSPSVTLLRRDGGVDRKLGPHPGGTIAVAWHPRRPLLAVGCRDWLHDGSLRDAVVVWDLERGTSHEIPQASWPWHVAFDAEGRLLTALGARHMDTAHAFAGVATFPVEVRSAGGALLVRHDRHTRPVFRMVVRDGWLLTGGHDRRAVLWPYATGGTPIELDGHDGTVHGVALPDDGSVVTACADGLLRRFDRAGALRHAFPIPHSAENVIAVPGGDLLVPCRDGVTRLYSAGGVLLRRFHGGRYDYPGDALALLPNREVLVGNGGRGRVGIWALDAPHRRRAEGADLVVPGPGQMLAASFPAPRRLSVLRGGAPALHLPLSHAPAGVDISRDGRAVAVGLLDGQVHLGDTVTGRWSDLGKRGGLWRIRFAADGRAFSTVGLHELVDVYESDAVAGWRHAGTFASADHAAIVAFAVPWPAVSGDRHILMRTPEGCGVWIFCGAATDRAPVQWLLRPDTAIVADADVSRDGRRLALACGDRRVRLSTWDETRASAHLEMAHERPVTWCRFDDTGDRVVTLDGDRFAWVWRWDGTLLACVRSAEDRTFEGAWFDVSDGAIVTVDDQRSVETWPLDLAAAEAELRRRRQLGATGVGR